MKQTLQQHFLGKECRFEWMRAVSSMMWFLDWDEWMEKSKTPFLEVMGK
jgi:hypothetical protein